MGKLLDKGGRRTVTDRRHFVSEGCFQEKRSGNDRRNLPDRRCGLDRRDTKGFRTIIGMDRRKIFKNTAI